MQTPHSSRLISRAEAEAQLDAVVEGINASLRRFEAKAVAILTEHGADPEVARTVIGAEVAEIMADVERESALPAGAQG